MTTRRIVMTFVLLLNAALIFAHAHSLSAGAASPSTALGAAEYAGHCASCHGGKLEGGMHAPPLVGASFQTNWAGKRARLFYSRIISTMPQNDPGSLSAQKALAITLYVFALNGIEWKQHTPSTPNDLNTLTIPTAPSS
jgi:mono/diheme cytochrome c family protein